MPSSPAVLLLSLLLLIHHGSSFLFAGKHNGSADGSGDPIPFLGFPKPGSKTRIYFSFITDSNEADLQLNKSSLLAARLAFTVTLALGYINQNFSNYYLKSSEMLDSKCDRTTSLDMFFEHFQSETEKTYLSSLCCGCSAATIPVAEISHHWNIPQISFSAGAEELTDRRRFRSFFRTIPSFQYVAPALAAVMQEFDWRQMVVIAQDNPAFNLITQGIQEAFELNGWNLQVKTTTDAGDMFEWDRDYRIVFVGAYIETTLAVLCEAAHRDDLNSGNHVWITMAWSAEWWETSANASCPPQLLEKMANNSLLIIPNGYLVIDPSEQQYFNLSADNLLLLEGGSGNLTQSHFVFPPGVVFDAVLALGLALMEAADRIANGDDAGCESVPGELVPLEEFSYLNDKMGCVLHQSVASVSFVGVTGLVEFDANGSRLGDNHIALLQHRLVDDQAGSGEVLKRVRVANIIVGQNGPVFTYTNGQSASTTWPDGVPYDGSPVLETETLHLAVVIIYSFLSSAGLIYAAVCLAFNFIFRNALVVKLSSPMINYLIIVGASLLYVTVYFLVYPVTDVDLGTVFCNVEIWLFHVGYTLCFGVFLAKTWRVYYIFTNPIARKKKVLIKDWVMFLIVGVVVGVQVIILMVGTATPQLQPRANFTEDTEHLHSMNDEGENVENVIIICIFDSVSQTVWIVVSLVYVALLEMAAIFMAFHTRKVRIKAINDSKEITALVYINSIILIVVGVAMLTLRNQHSAFAIVLGLSIVLAATIFLSLVFIPTAIRLYHDPDGEKALSTTATLNASTDKNMVTRTLSNRGMSFLSTPSTLSVPKLNLPALKEDGEETAAVVQPPEKQNQVKSLDREHGSEKKKNWSNGKTATTCNSTQQHITQV